MLTGTAEEVAEQAERILVSVAPGAWCVPQEWDRRIDCLIRLPSGAVTGEFVSLDEADEIRIRDVGEQLQQRSLGVDAPLRNELTGPLRIVSSGMRELRYSRRPSSGAAVGDNLAVGLSAWIIQDGNYGDFTRGQRAAFALEFEAQGEWTEIDANSNPTTSLINIGGPFYQAHGRVAHVAKDWWVMDLSVLAYKEWPAPAIVRSGAWLTCELCLVVDHFSYFERLSDQADAPALIYDWQIEKIEMQTGPWIEVSPRYWERDQNRLGWREIDRTDAWHDDEGYGEYLLHCKRLGDAPRRKR
jgi:hypothetical protein